MRLIIASLIAATLLCVNVESANAKIGWIMLGYAMGSGGSQSGSDSTIIFRAEEKVLETVDPMKVRHMASVHECFNPESKTRTKGSMAGLSNSEIFAATVGKTNVEKYVILQVVRVIDAGSASCGAFWFSYIEKELMAK